MNNVRNCYADFIEESFIKPIRTVTIVDDEYPTLNAFISGKLNNTQKKNIAPLKAFISVSRQASNNWMLDVYDGIPNGDNESQNLSSRLHNSDFLVLDYHLNGNGDDGPGKEALNVLKHLASTSNFNLVAIYTKGYEGDINAVFRDIICSLQKMPVIQEMSQKFEQDVEDALDNWDLEVDDVRTKLINRITDFDLLNLVKKYGKNPKKWSSGSKYLYELKVLFDDKPKDVKLSFKVLLWWLFNVIILKIKGDFGETKFSNFDWKMDGDIKWVHCDQLFVTVVGKECKPERLPEKILEALVNWNPHPHKLILTKLRNEMDERGIAIANKILDKQYVHAFWLKEIISSKKDEIYFKAWTVLCKHWDEIAAQTKDVMIDFILKIVTYLKKKGDTEEILKNFTNPEILNNKKQMLAHANCFNCSKLVEGYHLTTGHVLELQEKGSISYWVCVTPACDLEPGQNTKALEDRIPITLQRLYEGASACRKIDETGKISNEEILNRALGKATSKKILFLNLKNEQDVCIFSSISNIHSNANPLIAEFYATNFGKFDRNNQKLTLYRTDLGKNGRLIYNNYKATIVAQLRYEYALDLLLKTGACKSRIGLDFIGNN